MENAGATVMEQQSFRVYGYRWIVLLSFMFIVGMNQLLWITFAPITGAAAQFYHTTDLVIGLLSMSFMAVYIVLVIPSAWMIDTLGFRTAVGIGAILTAIFALTRGLFATSFPLVLVSQIGIAMGQPLVVGAVTKVAATWFPVKERATASGLGTLAVYLGVLVGMLITPALAVRYGMASMLLIYGIVTVVSALCFFIFAKGKPATPPCPAGHDVRVLMFDGLKQMLRQRDFLLLLAIFFVGLGMFNGVSTWIEDIVRPRGFSISQAGLLGGLMLIGGIIGAVILPILSDKARRRKPYIILSLCGLIPGLAGMAFATSYWLLLISGFLFGFFLLSSGPIGFQFGAELTHPAPEGTSNSLLLLMGQVSGLIFIFGMDALKSPATGAMTGSLLALLGLTVLCVLLATFIKERPLTC
ncbi:MAG TPA: MFS transporter [bacterium]|nr:MFS transporter [bacterium]